jgi:hypothetical protein
LDYPALKRPCDRKAQTPDARSCSNSCGQGRKIHPDPRLRAPRWANQSSARTRYTTALFPGVPRKCLMLKTANVQTIGDGPGASVDRRRARLRRRPGLPMCGQIRDRGTCRFGLLPWGRLRLAWWLSVSGLREWIGARCQGGRTPGASASSPMGGTHTLPRPRSAEVMVLDRSGSARHFVRHTGGEVVVMFLPLPDVLSRCWPYLPRPF